jgi:hypothetical protein
MKFWRSWIGAGIILSSGTLCINGASGDDQTKPGAGNRAAIALAKKSPIVESAYQFLLSQAQQIEDATLRKETLEALGDPCIRHRAHLTDAQKDAIIATLTAQGLVNPADAAAIAGGVKAGVFPPVGNDGSECPRLPQAFFSAPGSASLNGHHSYPGGLVVHESNNDVADIHLAEEYRQIYGHQGGKGGLPTVPKVNQGRFAAPEGNGDTDIFLDQDLILAAPLWHDWGKPMVFQWNANGSEFTELNFGGFGATDNNGLPGDSRTGGHHIIGVAEAMARGLSAALVITQASAHSAPTGGNEYKVVNWLRAAAIIAQIDPVAKGYLMVDNAGHFRLPALRQLGNHVDLANLGQTNVLAEYALHNLSDADFTYSGPAVVALNAILEDLAPEFGYDPSDPNYLLAFRNPVFSFLTAERLMIIYSERGSDGVRSEVRKVRDAGAI